MTQIKMQGIVECGDSCRVSAGDGLDGSVWVGDNDVVSVVEDTFPAGTKVCVALADSRWEGPLAVETGWGYSEYTPMDSDVLKVGDHDLVEILQRLDGQEITLWIADGPIDLLAEDES